MSEVATEEELVNRLLGKYAFESSPESVHASLVIDLTSKSILSAHNVDDPEGTADKVSKLWRDARELSQRPEVLRINAEKQYVLVGGKLCFFISFNRF